VLTQPRGLFAEILARLLDPWSYPRAIGVTVLYGSVLLFGYAAVRVLASSHARGASEA
jgi:hypothetical protein